MSGVGRRGREWQARWSGQLCGQSRWRTASRCDRVSAEPCRKGCGGVNLQAVFLLCICPLIKSLATKDRKKAERKRLLFRSIHCVQIHCLVHLLL